MAQPAVSVIIPTVCAALNKDVLVALDDQTCPPQEVIVIYDRDRRGPSWARNRGIEKATGDLVVFLDDDCLPPPHWIENFLRIATEYQADGIGGTYEETDPFLADRRLRQKLPDQEQLDTSGLVGAGGNLLYTRQWLEACRARDGHCFDESFRVSQDWELAWRSRRHGAKLVYTPVTVKHLKRLSPFAYWRLQFFRGVGIHHLYRVIRSSPSELTPHKSLIWDSGEAKASPRWLTALWRKGVGPFDVGSFSKLLYFWMFWVGEKFQSLGFLWGMIKHGNRPY